jgi:hypothetical protein
MLKKSKVYFNLTLIIVTFFLILSVDFIYTNIQKLIYPFNYEDPKSKIYKNFKPNLKESYISPISGKTLFCTDNNGFRNNCFNTGEKKFDYLVIGNIFTEGPELPFENTFVGQMMKKEDLRFANLGNRSLGITGINKKIKDIIRNDFVEFKEVILFVGPRIFHKSSNLNNLDNSKNDQVNLKKFVMKNFYFFNNFYNWLLFKTNRTKLWAYSKSNHYASNIKVNETFKENLNNLYLDLKKNDKKLSIVIYPYPYHFLYLDFDKKFIFFLEDFCKEKCNTFVNTYPVFNSKIKNKDIWKLIDEVYLPYSVHFNKLGNKIIADEVKKNLK